MVGPGRPAKGSKPPGQSPGGGGVKPVCIWCNEAKQTLKYVLPTQHGKREFCSEICLAAFRMEYKKVDKHFLDILISIQLVVTCIATTKLLSVILWSFEKINYLRALALLQMLETNNVFVLCCREPVPSATTCSEGIQYASKSRQK
jgi:hypothetical protein